MTMIPIVHKRSECIGCGFCTETAPEYWSMNDDGEAELQNILRSHNDLDHGEGFNSDQALLKEVEEGCPVSIIRVG